MRLSIATILNFAVTLSISLSALSLPTGAYAQEPGPAPSDEAFQFFVWISVFVGATILMTILLVAFLLWASGRPLPVVTPLLQHGAPRAAESIARLRAQRERRRLLLGLLGVLALVIVAALVAPRFFATSEAEETAVPIVEEEPAEAEVAAPAPVVAPAVVVETVQTSGCGGCHVIPGVAGASGAVGPSLAGLASRAEQVIESEDYTGEADTALEYIHESIIAPDVYIHEGFPANVMPPTFEETIPADQMEALVEYLGTLR